jgi:hypothetical protein
MEFRADLMLVLREFFREQETSSSSLCTVWPRWPFPCGPRHLLFSRRHAEIPKRLVGRNRVVFVIHPRSDEPFRDPSRPSGKHCETACSRLNTEDLRDWPGGEWRLGSHSHSCIFALFSTLPRSAAVTITPDSYPAS